MEVTIAKEPKEAVKHTWQNDFPLTTECLKCYGECRLGFVAGEFDRHPKNGFLCDLYQNNPDNDGYWLHDACAVAVYFCKKCLEPTALYNQA